MPSCFLVPIPFMITCFKFKYCHSTLSQCHLLSLDIMLLNILCMVIHQYVLHLSTIPCFFTLKCCSSGLLQCHLSFPIIHAYVALVFFCTYSASIQFYIQLVFYLLCSPVVSLALTSYSL